MMMAISTRRLFSKKVKNTEASRKVFNSSIPAPMPGEFLTVYKHVLILGWLPNAFLALSGSFLVLSAYKLYKLKYWQTAILLVPSFFFF